MKQTNQNQNQMLIQVYQNILKQFPIASESSELDLSSLNQYGRIKNKSFNERFISNSKFPFNTFYLQSQANQFQEHQDIFSFDKSQNQTFEENIEILKEQLSQFQYQNCYMITNLNNNNKNDTHTGFNLTSRIYLNSSQDANIHTALDYLTAITQNPEQIILNKSFQKRFYIAQKELKSQQITLEKLFNLSKIFRPLKTITDFSAINKSNSIYHIQNNSQENTEDEKINNTSKLFSSSNKLLTQSQLKSFNLDNLIYYLDLLVDSTKIDEMKTSERKLEFESSEVPKKKSLRALKKAIDKSLITSGNQKLFSLTQSSSIGEVIESMNNEKLKKYFPFKKEGISDIGHIKDFILKE